MAERTAVFHIDSRELSVPLPLLQDNSPYFTAAISTLPPASEYRIQLPAWATETALVSVLLFFRCGLVEFCDLCTAQRILWLAELFQCRTLTEKVIERVVLPQLDLSGALLYLSEAYRHRAEEGRWRSLLAACIGLCQQSADSLFRTYSAVRGLDAQLIVAIARGFFETRSLETFTDCEEIVESLAQASGHSDLLHFLQEERLSILRKGIARDRMELLCAIDSIPLSEDESTISSAPFAFAGCNWQLAVAVSAVAGTVQGLLRNLSTSHAACKHRLTAVSIYAEIPSHGVSDPVLLVVNVHDHSELVTPLLEVDVDVEQETSPWTVRLYGRFEGVYSETLAAIGRRANSVLTHSAVHLLSAAELSTLLQYKHLAVPSEDHVLDIIGRWCVDSNQSELGRILPSVHWEFVTLPKLISTAMRYPALKRCVQFSEKFRKELEHRALRADFPNFNKPRSRYAEGCHRQSYGSMREFCDGVCTALFETSGAHSGGSAIAALQRYGAEVEKRQVRLAALRQQVERIKQV